MINQRELRIKIGIQPATTITGKWIGLALNGSFIYGRLRRGSDTAGQGSIPGTFHNLPHACPVQAYLAPNLSITLPLGA